MPRGASEGARAYALGRRIIARVREAARLMVGVPDYQRYLERQRATHPGETPMSYEAFFRERQARRYGGEGGTGRCC